MSLGYLLKEDRIVGEDVVKLVGILKDRALDPFEGRRVLINSVAVFGNWFVEILLLLSDMFLRIGSSLG